MLELISNSENETKQIAEKFAKQLKKGDIVVVEFKQKIPITAGKYTLSFSCTQFNLQGALEVLSRKYDALLVEVITTKPTETTTGIKTYTCDSEIKIKK